MTQNRSEVEQMRHQGLPSRTWALFLLLVSLAYFISPIDLLPDPIYLDDVIALLASMAKVYFTFRQHRLARQPIEIEPTLAN